MFATKSVATTSFALAPRGLKASRVNRARFVAGRAPEAVNGRVAMLGFIAALGAEASSGETVFQQIGDAEPSILFAFIMFAAASLIPIFKGVKKEKFAFFSPEAEMLN